MKLIKRNYLNTLINVMGTPDIKVITGVRRSGKSKLLEVFKEYIKNNVENYNIIDINYNSLDFENIKEYHKLNDFVKERYVKGMKNFLLIDEVQMCEGFEKTINSLHTEEKYDIYITGSNAFLLSSDLATLFTGRTFEIEVYPFSFKEYIEYFKYEDIDEAFKKYVLEGGMSGSYLYNSIDKKYDYLNNVYNTLIVRDIFERNNIKDPKLMSSLNDFLMDNISNRTSLRNISNSLNSSESNLETNHKTIGNYILYLCESFAFYKICRYDIKGKKYLNSDEKYYLSDHAFKYARLGTKNMDYGRTYENIVAIELLRRGYEVYTGVLYNKEVDFVVTKQNEKIYIQVSDNLDNEETLKRETEPLLQIKDAYPKVIIARTKHDDYQYEGIQIYDIANWLTR
ncbi:aTPase [Clostridium sp. CAG:465]|nr:aTPase [Clostridium sp. CAG:465]